MLLEILYQTGLNGVFVEFFDRSFLTRVSVHCDETGFPLSYRHVLVHDWMHALSPLVPYNLAYQTPLYLKTPAELNPDIRVLIHQLSFATVILLTAFGV